MTFCNGVGAAPDRQPQLACLLACIRQFDLITPADLLRTKLPSFAATDGVAEEVGASVLGRDHED
jgi:hypothetical protein